MMDAKVDHEQLDPLLEIIYKKVGEMDRETIIRNFVSLEFNRFLSYYKDAEDLDIVDQKRHRDRDSRNDRRGRDRNQDRNRFGGSSSMSRLYINLGTKQGLNPNRLLGLINETVQDRSIRIGEIEVLRSFTFFEVSQRYAASVVKAFEGRYTDSRIKVDLAEGKSTPRPTARKKRPRSENRSKFRKKNS